LHRDQALRILRQQVTLGGKLAAEQSRHGVLLHAAALLEDTVVHAALDLEEHRRAGELVVKADAQLEAVFVAVDGRPEGVEIGGIEVKAVHRVAVIGLPHPVLIQLEPGRDHVPHLKGGRFVEHIFQLEPLPLHPIA
jgi:hypothetical protein